MLRLIQGPAGAGKSAVYERYIQRGELDMVADYTRIWVALSGAERDERGLYPVRRAGMPLVDSGMPAYLKVVAVRHGLAQGLSVGVTTSRRGEEDYWSTIAAQANTDFEVETIDPGRDVVEERLRAQGGGQLLDECATAISRWYG